MKLQKLIELRDWAKQDMGVELSQKDATEFELYQIEKRIEKHERRYKRYCKLIDAARKGE